MNFMNEHEAQKLIEEAYKKIRNLITQERWQEAHRACIEILRFDPANIKVIRMKNKIENEVRKVNKKAIKEDIKKINELWKNKKYEDLMANLKKLAPYISDYPPLKKIILRAERDYEKQLAVQHENYYLTELQSIHQLTNTNKYQEAIRMAEKLRIIKLHEKDLKVLIKNIKLRWIDYQIQQNENLIKSNKYEDLLIFLQGLLRIDKQSKKIKKVMESAKNKYKQFKIEEKREFIYKGIEEIKTLYQLKKYERSFEAAQEILDIDPDNKTARKYFLWSRRKLRSITDKELIAQMKTAQKQIKNDYKMNKKGFIKI